MSGWSHSRNASDSTSIISGFAEADRIPNIAVAHDQEQWHSEGVESNDTREALSLHGLTSWKKGYTNLRARESTIVSTSKPAY